MKALPQTPRRSRRGQPIATPARSNAKSNIHRAWIGQPLYIRPTNAELDCTPDENSNSRRDDEEGGDSAFETVFYQSFEMEKVPKVSAYRSKAKGKKKDEPNGIDTFSVGDTVLIKTDDLSLKNEPPSIAVIVSMWETRKKGSDGFDASKMRLRVHWFQRPPKPRPRHFGVKREHFENEIYYTLSQNATTFPELFLGHCVVTSKNPKPPTRKLTTPSSRPSSPTKKCRSPSSDSEDDESEDNNFFCRNATSGQSSIYYSFNWEEHHLSALASTASDPPAPGQLDLDWGNGTQWDVLAGKGKRSALRKDKGEGNGRAAARPRKKPKLDTGLATIESESEGGGTDVDFAPSSDEDEDDVLPDAVEEDLVSPQEEASDDEITGIPKTPSRKKRKRTQDRGLPSSPTKQTPRKLRTTKTVVHPTPQSKSLLRARKKIPGTPSKSSSKFAVRPQQVVDNTTQDLSHLPRDPWLRAMHVLHVGARPDALPCREEEFERVLRCIGELLEEGGGGCVYISGVPGTGKTATVHAVVRQLKRMAESGEANPFTYVEINGLRIPEPAAAYNLLWEGVSGHEVAKDGHLRIGTKESLRALTRHFSVGGGSQGPQGHACVVLMDELDQLVTVKQDVVYNFFNWPTLIGSKLIVIAVANTMDLPERVMSGRVRSRLGMIRINFQPYTTPQLETIVKARLDCAKEGMGGEHKEVIGPDAIKFASMKVSSISGDARRVLDICRRTVELVQQDGKIARVPEVKEVIQQMQNSPTAAYLRDCSLHERMMLASLVKCIKREGVEEIKWGEVQHQHLLYTHVLTSDDDPKRKPTPAELAMVLDSLVASRAMLVEDGAGIAKKPEGERKVLLNLEQNEVERVLSDLGGPRWKNVLCS